MTAQLPDLPPGWEWRREGGTVDLRGTEVPDCERLDARRPPPRETAAMAVGLGFIVSPFLLLAALDAVWRCL